jgi:hypothetical protein
MAMRIPAERDEAFYVVNKTLVTVRKRLSQAFDAPISGGTFNSVMREVMAEMYPPKNAGKKRRTGRSKRP